jgi:hypothetical protein
MKYSPDTGETHVLASGLWFANGVALSQDESFVVVSETNGGFPYPMKCVNCVERVNRMQCVGLMKRLNSMKCVCNVNTVSRIGVFLEQLC